MRAHNLILPVLLAAAAALLPAEALAQTCLGLPTFGARSVHVQAAGEFPDSARSWVGGLAAGSRNVFANAGVGRVTYTGIEEAATLGFLELGVRMPVAGRAELCPVAGGYLAAGPDEDGGAIKVTTRSASGGGSIGYPFAVAEATIVPRVAVIYERFSQKVVEEGIGSVTETTNSGLLDLGLGLVYGDRFAVQPVVHIPISGTDDRVTFGALASVALGWPPSFAR